MNCNECYEMEAKVTIHGVGSFCASCLEEGLMDAPRKVDVGASPLTLSAADVKGRDHRFDLGFYDLPRWRRWVASEEQRYTFEALGRKEEDPRIGLVRLLKNTIQGLGHASLEKDLLDRPALGPWGTGKVTLIDTDEREEYPALVIDGQVLSFLDFGHLASTYEGEQMEYRFVDSTEPPLGSHQILKKVDVRKEAVLRRFFLITQALLVDNTLPQDRERIFFDQMEESIDDLPLMLAAGYHRDLVEVA